MSEIDLIADATHEVLKGHDISQAWLFGSRARGE